MPRRAVETSEAELSRQSEVLRELIGDADRTQLAAQVGLSYSQLSRYAAGDTLLPSAYYGVLAAAFNMTRVEFIRRLLAMDEQDYSIEEFCAHLSEAGLPPEDVDELSAIARDEPGAGRRSLAEGYVRIWRRLNATRETRQDSFRHLEPVSHQGAY